MDKRVITTPAPGSDEDLPKEPIEAEAPQAYICDRCGFEMIEEHCKVVCPNCGARWDCSDLSIYTD